MSYHVCFTFQKAWSFLVEVEGVDQVGFEGARWEGNCLVLRRAIVLEVTERVDGKLVDRPVPEPRQLGRVFAEGKPRVVIVLLDAEGRRTSALKVEYSRALYRGIANLDAREEGNALEAVALVDAYTVPCAVPPPRT